MAIPIDHKYNVTLWVPADAALEDAVASVTIKAPELGNSNDYGRTQVQVKTRAGQVIVYDQGTVANLDNAYEFKDVPDSERAALIVFLDSVTWGSTVVAIKDHNGVVKFIRITSTKITSKDNGYMNRNANELIILWDFTLDFTDVSNTILQEQDYNIMPTALTLHLTDYNSPHSPEFRKTLDIADGAKVLDSFKCREYDGHIWIGVATKNDKKHIFQILVDQDGYLTTDATASFNSITQACDANSSVADITFTTDVSGAGAAQICRLKAATSVDGYVLTLRRVKVGKR